ncbi:hypothetical protein IHN63_04440 [Deinococcus sp. 6YEL10]|uniref:hypothetical protein n=1 Tax=Deinococcus sp. 6YEL10 TaxID=2745870 RepID=UPI001E2AE927|nr:hypothetical protein [Deinococcus sp. 6YEL10]MCD0160551.1 hypothetical protein [Deinococcus sp. 6YEL10]
MPHSRALLTLAALTLSVPAASGQSVSPLNATEVSALLGNFGAITVTAPAGTKRAIIRVVSQLGTAEEKDAAIYQGMHSLYVYDFRKPIRLMVGLAGDPIRRGKGAAPLSLPGVHSCASDQQLAILGASTASETNLTKQCMGLGDRADATGGSPEVIQMTPPKLNVWTPVYSWYFLKGADASDAAFDAARKDPSARIVWWVYFSSTTDGAVPAAPLYTPTP